MNSILKYTAMALMGAAALAGCKDADKGSASIPYGTTVTIDKATLLDKINDRVQSAYGDKYDYLMGRADHRMYLRRSDRVQIQGRHDQRQHPHHMV